MQNVGSSQFSYDTFKAAYDADPKLQDIVKNFDQNTIELKTSEVDDLPNTQGGSKDTVSSMAKSAVDLKDL